MSDNNYPERYGRINRLIHVPALRPKRYTVIGQGSMGQPITVQLARHGVGTVEPGRIRLIDGDVVSERNLVGTDYLPRHLGMPKVTAAASLIREIDDRVHVSCWAHMVERRDIPQIVVFAQDSDLMGLFADSFELMLEIAEACYDICPLVMAVFGPNCDYAEVAFSVPGVTVPLTTSLGRQQRQAIHTPQALGCATAYVANFVIEVCLRLLLGSKGGEQLVPCYANAPLFVLGLRPTWIFAQQPPDLIRSIYCVGAPTGVSRHSE